MTTPELLAEPELKALAAQFQATIRHFCIGSKDGNLLEKLKQTQTFRVLNPRLSRKDYSFSTSFLDFEGRGTQTTLTLDSTASEQKKAETLIQKGLKPLSHTGTDNPITQLYSPWVQEPHTAFAKILATYGKNSIDLFLYPVQNVQHKKPKTGIKDVKTSSVFYARGLLVMEELDKLARRGAITEKQKQNLLMPGTAEKLLRQGALSGVYVSLKKAPWLARKDHVTVPLRQLVRDHVKEQAEILGNAASAETAQTKNVKAILRVDPYVETSGKQRAWLFFALAELAAKEMAKQGVKVSLHIPTPNEINEKGFTLEPHPKTRAEVLEPYERLSQKFRQGTLSVGSKPRKLATINLMRPK